VSETAGPQDARLSQWLDVLIRRRIEAADGIVLLELVRADGGPMPAYEAGAHVDVLVGPELVRQYSLSNDPSERDRYVLGILLEKQSRGGSKAIHTSFNEGSTIQIGAPRNAFSLRPNMSKAILLAGGIGITPIKAMVHSLHNQGVDFALHYCARSRRAAAFCDEFANAPFAAKVNFHIDDENGGPVPLNSYLPQTDNGAHLYVCGPGGFIEAVRQYALGAGWPAERVHVEHFVSQAPAAGDCFTVEAVRSGVRVEVGEGETIVQALTRAGLEVLTSCEQGLCGVCLTEVLEGIPDHHDQYQTDDEKASNKHMTICCSRAKTPVLKLDI
jgi:vanillate O-demethylase ferredoxin subunit